VRPWALWQLNTLPSQSRSLSECLSWWSWRADAHFPGWHRPKSPKSSFDCLQETPPINTTVIQLLYKQTKKKFKWINTTLILQHLIYLSIMQNTFLICLKRYAQYPICFSVAGVTPLMSALAGSWALAELSTPRMPIISHETGPSCWPVKQINPRPTS